MAAGRAPRQHEQAVIAYIYAHLEASDLSGDLLQYASADNLVLPMLGLYWSDCSSGDRPGGLSRKIPAHE